MIRLYSARNGLESHDLRLFLEAHGIEAKVFGDNSPLEAIFSFTPDSAPTVYVREEDLTEAKELAEQFFDEPTSQRSSPRWKCGRCGEVLEGHFDLCWNCESPRDVVGMNIDASTVADSPTNAESLRNDDETSASTVTAIANPHYSAPTNKAREIWLEIVVVLSVVWLPYFAYYLFRNVEATGDSFLVESIWSIVDYTPAVLVVLFVMHRSGLPWGKFGIKRPRLVLDATYGLLLWITMVSLHIVIYRFVSRIDPLRNVWEIGRTSTEFRLPASNLDFAMLLPLCLAIGFTEELSMRTYLIPRLRQVFQSSTKSIVVAALLFGSYHLYQGIGPALVTFVIGLVFGIAFCWLRRLWPLVVAHALWDFLAYTIPQISEVD